MWFRLLSGGISAAAIALDHSEKLTAGVGVVPAPMRNVALTAMEIATLARRFPGRERIGVGHEVLRGERVTFHGCVATDRRAGHRHRHHPGHQPDQLRAAVAWIREGEKLRQQPHTNTIVTYLPCAIGPDAEQVLAARVHALEARPHR